MESSETSLSELFFHLLCENEEIMINNAEVFTRKMQQKRILICAHRGSFGGGIIENTLPAFNNALNLGADIIEMDVSRTKDGELFIFHDTEEKRMLNLDRNFTTYYSEEIEKLYYINRYGFYTKQRVEKLEDVLKALKNKALINLDRCYREESLFFEVINMIDRLNMLDQIIIKAPPTKIFCGWLKSISKPLMFIPIITNVEQVKYCEANNIDMIGLELVFNDLRSPLLDDKLITEWKNKGYALWANSLVIDDKYPLAAGLDDYVSINDGEEAGWKKLIDYGFTIIQTDWVYLLKKYRDKLL